MIRGLVLAAIIGTSSLQAQEISWVCHSQKAVNYRLNKEKLSIKAIHVKYINVVGQGTTTLLIWKCGNQQIYHYAPWMTRREIHQLRGRMISLGHNYFPIYFAE